MNHIAQLASVQGKSAEDLGSIPRSQPLFMFFFNSQSRTLHVKRSTMYYQDLTIQFTNASDLMPSPWRTTIRLSQACALDGGKVKWACLIWAQSSTSHPP